MLEGNSVYLAQVSYSGRRVQQVGAMIVAVRTVVPGVGISQ